MTEHFNIVVITGLSGAGHSTALKVFEDMGYEAVDNLPFSLFSAMIPAPGEAGDRAPLAVSLDSRTRGFSPDALVEGMSALQDRDDLQVTLLFMDCDDAVLLRRFTETRRTHPLVKDRGIEDGIAAERELLSPLKTCADMLLDTSEMSVHDLKRNIMGQFGEERGDMPPFSLMVESFSFRRGLPRAADLVMDVRFLDNPHYDPALRPLTGQSEDVGKAVAADPHFTPFFESWTKMLRLLLPRYSHEGKAYLTIAIGCTGGKHRSVYVAERLAAWLEEERYAVTLMHRDMPREHEGQKKEKEAS